MNVLRLRVTIIIGSTRKGRRGPTIARWFADQAGQLEDLEIDVFDLAEARLPADLSDAPGPEVAGMSERFSAADAFVVVVPEYNHSFPAALKIALDWSSGEWKAKPVAFVSYGGRSGGLRAVEQLRQVFPEMHAMTVRDTVSFHDVWSEFDSGGQPNDPDGCAAAARAMLSQLTWWGYALKEGRTRRPYR